MKIRKKKECEKLMRRGRERNKCRGKKKKKIKRM